MIRRRTLEAAKAYGQEVHLLDGSHVGGWDGDSTFRIVGLAQALLPLI